MAIKSSYVQHVQALLRDFFHIVNFCDWRKLWPSWKKTNERKWWQTINKSLRILLFMGKFFVSFFTNPVLFGHGPEILRWCFISFHFRFVLLNSWRKLFTIHKSVCLQLRMSSSPQSEVESSSICRFNDEAFIRGHELKTFKIFTPRQPY